MCLILSITILVENLQRSETKTSSKATILSLQLTGDIHGEVENHNRMLDRMVSGGIF